MVFSTIYKSKISDSITSSKQSKGFKKDINEPLIATWFNNLPKNVVYFFMVLAPPRGGP